MARIGEILSHSVPLNSHDIEEILQEQKVTRQCFGEAALALGKVRPDQVWNAWLLQLRSGTVDATRVRDDAAAVNALPAELAIAYGLVPLRVRGNVLVVAAAEQVSENVIRQLEWHCQLRLVVALSTTLAVGAALARLYPTAASAA